jgi:hypothetical protein
MTNATNLNYLNLLRMLMLRPFLLTLGRDTDVAFQPTSLSQDANSTLMTLRYNRGVKYTARGK